jgi:hypothetical protein
MVSLLLAIKAGHDAIELAAALADADVEVGLTRYDAARRPASANEMMFAPVNEMLRSVTSSDDDPLSKTQRALRRRRTRGERRLSA